MSITLDRLTTNTEAALFGKCVELLFSHAKIAIVTALAVGMLMAGLLWRIFPHGWLLAWLVSIIVASLVRLWHVFAFFRADRQTLDTRGWLMQFVAGSAVAAMLWGVAGVIFISESYPIHQVIVLITLTGLSAAAVTAYSSVLGAYRVFLWIVMSPVAVMMFWLGDIDHIAIGGVVFIYTFMMSHRAAVMVNHTIVESIRHGLRVAELLELNEGIINYTDSGITAYTADGECVLMNTAATRILGIPPDLDMRHNFRTNPSWQEYGVVEMADKVLQTGEQKSIDLPMRTIYGWNIWIAAELYRMMQGDQPILLMVFREISPHRNVTRTSQSEARKTQAAL